MTFNNRRQAGVLLAAKLKKYVSENDYVYALPRGGVVVADPVAHALHAPLGLIFVRKIGAPWDKEMAIAALSESRELVTGGEVASMIPDEWFEQQLNDAITEMKRQHELYLPDSPAPIAEHGVAIIVDDGIATGLTLRAAIAELRDQHPRKIIIASPIITENVWHSISRLVDRVIALEVIPDQEFKGSIGSYYNDFSQVTDREVITLLRRHEREQLKSDINDVLRNIARY